MTQQAIERLKWPQDRWQLALLSISDLQTWYAAQDAKHMVFLANTPEFKRFWNIVYLLPVRLHRKYMKLKRVLRQGSWLKA